MPEEDRRTVDDVRRFAAELGGLARTLGERGMRLGYHNHDFEFRPLGGTTAWAVLLAELPAEVEIELDVYWVSVAGRDPATEIRAAADRVRLLHMKDREAGASARDVAAGDGILDFAAIVEAGREAGVEWYVAELDDPGDPIADIAAAQRYLQTLAGDGGGG
jgi:sugar phosphate isomerase/epimerase